MKRTVVKVGGSLFGLADLGPRLQAFLERLQPAKVCLVAGGGAAAEHVRRLDRLHGLGRERSHWLAVRAMSLGSHFLAALLPQAEIAGALPELTRGWAKNRPAILDPFEVLQQDESSSDCLPHDWSVTSDSIAARIAQLLPADELILLKSCALPVAATFQELSREGVVDAWFPRVADSTPLVRIVNLRSAIGSSDVCTIRASR